MISPPADQYPEARNMKMRKQLIIGGAVLLALLVAVHYAHWRWNDHKADRQKSNQTTQQGNEICGIVASVYYDSHGNGQPTFIDLGHPYPDQTYTIVIWDDNLSKFNPPPQSWQGKNICVTGSVKLYKNKLEINAYTAFAEIRGGLTRI